MTDLQKAKKLLAENDYTCVLCKDEKTRTSTQRGVRPLVEWLESDEDFEGFSAADKVVGRGAAFLYVLLGVNAVYSHVISYAALEVLRAYNITVEYNVAVEHIINRRGDGICPFESAVMDITDVGEAYIAIKQKMREIGIASRGENK
ncbi:MAG: DUF1893 domain-containing protein [Ruminococcaceae bacterium]|nr:DUF1893 domain-containing protein [Oscillospiraceae bacterium]